MQTVDFVDPFGLIAVAADEFFEGRAFPTPCQRKPGEFAMVRLRQAVPSRHSINGRTDLRNISCIPFRF